MKYPYEFVDQKVQCADYEQLAVQLYSYSGRINKDNLKEFCHSKNTEFPDASLYKLVIFDDRENAVFTEPLSNLYLDKENTKHVRAVYTYNPAEEYSNLKIVNPYGDIID